MGGSLTSPNKIKDAYKKLVFYDNNKLKIDNGTTDVVITEADNFSSDIVAGTGIVTAESGGQTTISVKDADVLLQNEDINGGIF
jgi:archaellum component FlaF (FlaF/FlaG flagellin family)